MTHSKSVRTLQTGEWTLEYELTRTARRRTVAITVEPDRRIVVLAPGTAESARIDTIVRQRVDWIRRQWRTLEALPAPELPRQWVAGETHRYLGRQYRLKPVDGTTRSVRLAGAFFVVTLRDRSDRQSIRRLMEAWYRQHAILLLTGRVERLLHATTWLDVSAPAIELRALRQRWGSTTARGRVYFNPDLVKLPLGCIDYVVAHELVHLKVPNHGPAFWRMLTRVMPDWKRWRERLARVEV